MLIGAPNRVMPPEQLDRTRPRRDIMHVMNSEFLPSLDDNRALIENFKFHVMEAMVKYVPCMQHMKEAVPKFISHPNINEMSLKSQHLILDLLDKNENKSDDMIDIMRKVHTYIPHLPMAGTINTLERMVFGGDVLTNERAYEAQLALMNGTNEMERLLGVIHRPEGLHMCMNFCKYILEVFFSRSSTQEQGTLYNSAILVDRFQVTLDMTTGYNKARTLISDALDAHILGAVCTHLGMQTAHDSPEGGVPSDDASKVDQLDYLSRVAGDIVQHYVLQSQTACTDASQAMDKLEREMELLKSSGGAYPFKCNFRACSKIYKTVGWLQAHLRTVHNVVIDLPVPLRKEIDKNYDGVFNYASAFMKVALLYRDITDAYKMGDGDRVFRDIKFMFLHLSSGKHVKYRLWLWRMLAYDMALLSQYERYEYRHNIAMNLIGGVRNCVANDNVVEIYVHKIKEAMRAMGANVTYAAVQKVTKCLDVLDAMTEKLAKPKSGKHAATKNQEDIEIIATSLLTGNVFVHTTGREHATYPNFPSDLLNDIDIVKLNQWINTQKKRALREMQVL